MLSRRRVQLTRRRRAKAAKLRTVRSDKGARDAMDLMKNKIPTEGHARSM